MTRKVCCWASLASVVMVLTACGRSDDPHGPKSEGASARSRSELDGPVEIVTRSGVAMVSLPGGEFIMGSNKGNADEAPAHKVRVSAFLIDKYEVTHEMFRKAQLPNPSRWQDNPNKPVERVRWRDAKQYSNARSLLEGLKRFSLCTTGVTGGAAAVAGQFEVTPSTVIRCGTRSAIIRPSAMRGDDTFTTKWIRCDVEAQFHLTFSKGACA